MSRGKIIAGVVVLAIIVAIVGGVLYSSASSAPSVTTAKATTETLGVLVTASGKLEGARRADVYPPTAGTLKSVKVEDGQEVAAGDTLAVMDTAPLKAQVKSAASALAGAKAQQDAVNKGIPSAIDKAAASAGQDSAQAAYDAAKAGYDAYVALHPGATPSTDATLAGLDISVKQAYAGLQSAKSGVSKLSTAAKVSLAKDSAAKAVAAASAGLSLAQDTLDDATLVAPINGIVVFNALGAPGTDGSYPKAEEGSAIAPGTAAFTVVDLSDLNFNAQVDEADVARVNNGMKVTVSLDAFPDDTFSGTVTAVRSTAIQTTTGGIAFPVLVKVDGAGKRLFVGMSGSADIEVEAVSSALVVPIESVLDENGKKFVFVLGTDNKVKKTEVTTGALTDTRAQIASGISEGTTVVTSQLTALKDGMTVRAQ